MAKKNETEESMLVLKKQYRDPETGEAIKFEKNDVNDLLLREQQIRNGYQIVAAALKDIRDRRLYLLRDMDSMREYITSFVGMSESYGRKLLYIADHFSEVQPELLNSFSKNSLLDLAVKEAIVDEMSQAKVFQGEVTLPDGEVLPLEDYVKRITREIKTDTAGEIETKIEKIRKQKEIIDGKEELLKHYKSQIEESEEHIKKLEKSIQSLVEAKDVDPRAIVFITHKKEGMRLIDESLLTILRALGHVNGIPRDLVDPELAGKFGEFFAAVETSVQNLKDNWGGVLWLPGKRERTDDVVPA